ncbi:MAG: RrF2 family transcriptional regulator [Gemmataceae bacterium]
MTLLSRKADYAFLILAYLHRSNTGGTARAIAERYQLSRPFVANILKELCQKGFCESHRGVKGGYTLRREKRMTTIAELLEALEDGFQLTVCSEHNPGTATCEHQNVCPVKGPLNDIHQRIRRVLESITLEELFTETEPARDLIQLLPRPPVVPVLTNLA